MPQKDFSFLSRWQKDRPELKAVRKKIINFLLIIASVFGLPAIIAGAIISYEQGYPEFSFIYSFLYLTVLITTIFSRRLPEKVSPFILITLVYLTGSAALVRVGLSGVGIYMLIGLCIFSSVFFTLRAGLYAILVSVLTMVAVSTGMVTGGIVISPEKMMTSTSVLAWIPVLAVFTLVTSGMVVILEWFRFGLIDALEQQAKNAVDLENSVISLESQIKARKKFENDLRQSEERFRNLAELLPETIFEVDITGKITFVNRRAFDHFRYTREDLDTGLNGLDVLAPEDHERGGENILKIFNGEDVGLNEYTAIRKDGTKFPAIFHSTAVMEDGKPVGLRGFIIDISDRKSLEDRLKQAEKMEAIGTLAGGVAHDLNNILSGIVTYPDYFLMELPDDSPMIGPMTTMKKSGMRAAAIVQDLLTLARRGITKSEVVNVNSIIKEYLNSVECAQFRSDHPNIEVSARLAEDLLNIKGSPVHLTKTVMNLFTNAAEAMNDGGKIKVSTENSYVDKPVHGYNDIVAGDYVVLSVTDNGKGMSSMEKQRMFEPFFTTKKMGKSGTGLGLAVVWGTVKDHSGYLHVISDSGRGTTFRMYFPITREEVKSKPPSAPEDYMGRGEFILVVDDYEDQRELANSLLTRLGYRVDVVESGEAAIELIRDNPADLLVLDMIMDPGMDGLDTFREILKVYPDQKAVIASGFSKTDRVIEAQKLGAGEYIKKPYSIKNLGLAVRSELDR
jgi:two-component system, cell cycle sensor histidine kinase and response regulator CckA